MNLTVIKHYLIDSRLRGTSAVIRYGILPGIGFLLTAWLWTSLSQSALIVGLSWAAAGLVYLLAMTRFFRRRPPNST